jgi:hypothetical protein
MWLGARYVDPWSLGTWNFKFKGIRMGPKNEMVVAA